LHYILKMKFNDKIYLKIKNINNKKLKIQLIIYLPKKYMGIGDWGLGIGDWGLGVGGLGP